MIFEEPKVEFVSLNMDDITTTSSGSQIDICQGDRPNDKCDGEVM